MPRRVCFKNILTCILKNHFSEFGAQFGSAINAFKATHSDSERNSHLVVCWRFTGNHENPLRISLPNGFWGDAQLLIRFTLFKMASTTQVKKHYKTLIILLVRSKSLKIMILSYLHLKCMLKNQKSEREAYFYMMNLFLARGISWIPMVFSLKFGRPKEPNRHFVDFACKL